MQDLSIALILLEPYVFICTEQSHKMTAAWSKMNKLIAGRIDNINFSLAGGICIYRKTDISATGKKPKQSRLWDACVSSCRHDGSQRYKGKQWRCSACEARLRRWYFNMDYVSRPHGLAISDYWRITSLTGQLELNPLHNSAASRWRTSTYPPLMTLYIRPVCVCEWGYEDVRRMVFFN